MQKRLYVFLILVTFFGVFNRFGIFFLRRFYLYDLYLYLYLFYLFYILNY